MKDPPCADSSLLKFHILDTLNISMCLDRSTDTSRRQTFENKSKGRGQINKQTDTPTGGYCNLTESLNQPRADLVKIHLVINHLLCIYLSMKHFQTCFWLKGGALRRLR